MNSSTVNEKVPSSGLMQTIRKAMNEIQDDKEIFSRVEVPQNYYQKYSEIEGNAKVFDFWGKKFSELKSQVSEAEKVKELFYSLYEDISSYFKNTYKITEVLKTSLKEFLSFPIIEVRATIDIFNGRTTLLLLHSSENEKEPEELDTYPDFQNSIYSIQEKANDDYMDAQEFHICSLSYDDDLDLASIRNDFPLLLK